MENDSTQEPKQKIRCTCECHDPGSFVMHFMACCNNGFIETSGIEIPTDKIDQGLNTITDILNSKA